MVKKCSPLTLQVNNSGRGSGNRVGRNEVCTEPGPPISRVCYEVRGEWKAKTEPSSIFASLSEDAKETTVIVKKSFKRQAWGDK